MKKIWKSSIMSACLMIGDSTLFVLYFGMRIYW